ncbi:MAG: GntR family transcriptional regulator [Candidatus Aminicenantes bacterium]|nr:MAG: GntR family transcriptional regulator [Candidatus Aminicenantes bacterium]
MHDKRSSSYKHGFPKTLSQSIYNYLKESIINNKLKANQRINEKEIAATFGISTTPVREAVRKLGAEGFVTINFHKEAVVKEISHDELKEIFVVLGALDSIATGIAAENIKSKDLVNIEDLTKEMERNCRITSLEKYIDLNQEIHNKIWDSLPNKFLMETIKQVNDQMLRYKYVRMYAFRKPGVLERSLNEHKELLKALKAKDKKRLKTLTLRHWGLLLKSPSLKEELSEYLSNQ